MKKTPTPKNTGGPAFPFEEIQRRSDGVVGWTNHEGMTIRDYFAAKALQGICASGPSREWSNGMLAQEAYQLADAMLSHREK